MKSQRRSTVAPLLLVLSCTVTSLLILGCYKGVSDSDIIHVLQTEVAAPNRVAMLVERSDHAALSGTNLFVFVADHTYSETELRKRLYGLDPVFMAGGAGLKLHWSRPDELTIQCHSCGMTKDIIEKQKFTMNDVAIKYVGFP
jgi:hypothetical protein